ncbi:MAG TPA: FAD-dependent monooxygenase [Polyangiaceae bacterium]|nr:FAD-dependent monooxygenase [Polyangiaceae bacterium]
MSQVDSAIVVGAGVAGLATAVALSRTGVRVAVCERSRDVRRTGGALLLWSNAMAVLADLGLAERVLEVATLLEVTEFRSWSGDTLWTLPVEDLSVRHGAPSVVISRADLVDVLLAALPPDSVRFGTSVASVRTEGARAAVLLEDGSGMDADVVVGADGIRSSVRAELLGGSPPAGTGEVAWVGIVPYEHLLVPPGVALATAGDGRRFWCAGMNRGRVYWYATVKDTARVDSLADLANAFRDAHAPIADVVAETAPEDVVVTAITDRPPTRGWSRGRVVLVGDAAHPATPDLGQGACQALESAIVLAAHLSNSADVETAFARYERQRFSRCERLTLLARATAEGSGISGSLFGSVRDLGVRTMLPAIALTEFDWILSPRG